MRTGWRMDVCLGPPGVLGVLAVVMGLAGCSTPVAGSLEEAQANRVLVTLDRAGVGSDKEPDPTTEGRYRVVVSRDDVPRAMAALRDEDLPAEAAPGLLEAMGKGAIMPSQIVEHAQFVAGLAGELERTLASIDGVLAARVHLSLPLSEPLSDAPRPKATASVLLKHRGAIPPIEGGAIKRLVAGAAPALSPEEVAVVLVSRPAIGARAEQPLARFGPIWVTRGSLSLLRMTVGAGLLVTLSLLGTVLLLWSRLRRTNALLQNSPPEPVRPAA
jgi:type III secretion protein J